MIRVQIDEWLPEPDPTVPCGFGSDVNEPLSARPGGTPPLTCHRTLLLQDFEQLDTTAVIALLNGLAKPALCQCGHEKAEHAGSSCRGCCLGGTFSTSDPSYHLEGRMHVSCDCKEYQPVTVNDFKAATRQLDVAEAELNISDGLLNAAKDEAAAARADHVQLAARLEAARRRAVKAKKKK